MLSLYQVRSALGRDLLCERNGEAREFAGVCNDSRQARQGDLFFALQTESRDGHAFVSNAIGNGAAGVVVSRDVPVAEGVAVFHVRDTWHALGDLASYWRNRFDVPVIAITGTVGKTTTKELTAALLSSKHRVLKSPANFNDEIGLSMTLFQLNNDYDRVVVEVAMTASGEIARLCEIARPSVSVVLNVGPTHLERLGSMEAIAAAKAEAVECLTADGCAILNADDERVARMASLTKARVVTFGMGEESDIGASEVRGRGLAGVDFTLRCGRITLPARTPVPGADLVYNALAAVAVALVDGMSVEDAARALAEARIPTRLQKKMARSGALILDDSYNAGPDSMLAALDVLGQITGRHVALLGDMLELGDAETDAHYRVGGDAAKSLDELYTIGERGELIAQAARDAGLERVTHFRSREEAARTLASRLGPGDVLLVKASHGIGLDAVVAELVV